MKLPGSRLRARGIQPNHRQGQGGSAEAQGHQPQAGAPTAIPGTDCAPGGALLPAPGPGRGAGARGGADQPRPGRDAARSPDPRGTWGGIAHRVYGPSPAVPSVAPRSVPAPRALTPRRGEVAGARRGGGRRCQAGGARARRGCGSGGGRGRDWASWSERRRRYSCGGSMASSQGKNELLFADWMAALPGSLHSTPLTNLAIPGGCSRLPSPRPPFAGKAKRSARFSAPRSREAARSGRAAAGLRGDPLPRCRGAPCPSLAALPCTACGSGWEPAEQVRAEAPAGRGSGGPAL